MTITSEDEKAVEYNDSGVSITRHWFSINMTQLRLSLEVEWLIECLHCAAIQCTVRRVTNSAREALAAYMF